MAMSGSEGAMRAGVDEESGVPRGHRVDAAYGARGRRGDAETRRDDDAASVVVSEVWRAAGLGEGCQGLAHFLDCAIERRWDGERIYRSHVSREPEEIQGIDVVVDGLLEVEAVGTNLGFGLLQDDFPAAGLPAGRIGDLRTKQTDGEERHTFTEQVRVGGEVGG